MFTVWLQPTSCGNSFLNPKIGEKIFQPIKSQFSEKKIAQKKKLNPIIRIEKSGDFFFQKYGNLANRKPKKHIFVTILEKKYLFNWLNLARKETRRSAGAGWVPRSTCSEFVF